MVWTTLTAQPKLSPQPRKGIPPQPGQGQGETLKPTKPTFNFPTRSPRVSEIPLPHIPVTGHLKYFAKEWKEITSDREIVDMVLGMHIELTDKPVQSKHPFPIPFSAEETKFMDNHVKELLAKNVITKTFPEEGDFVSTVFLRPKPNGKFRMILNLKKFNWFVEYNKFKMDTFQFMLTLVTPSCFMGSIDLTDAYHVIGLALAHQKFMKFFWKGVMYKFTCLAFGLSLAPRKFTKLMKPVMAKIRRQGYTIANYLDDLFQAEKTFEECAEAITFTHRTLCSLGFIPNDEKSVYTPTQVLDMLGFTINSVTMHLYLPANKQERIVKICSDIIKYKQCTTKYLCMIIGVLISNFPAVPLGQSFYRNLERCKIYHLKKSGWNYNSLCTLDFKSIKELKWWCKNTVNSSGPISRGPPEIMITTDASSRGWGSDVEGQCANGHFSEEEKCFTINTKETLAILFALRSFKHILRGKHVLIKSDSTTAISYVKKMGGMDSLLRGRIAKQIWQLAKLNNFWITITHISGIFN